MDSPSVLRQQSQNKIHSDFLRMKNEHNKILVNQKPSKPVSAPHLSKQDNENKDPGRSDTGRKAAVRPAVSRLPVLAKSLHLQTPIDFRQSHCRWEEKPLAGKAKKKKPCTRPVPFNLSQPKSSTTSENPQPGAHAVQPEINVGKVRLRTQNINSKPTKHSSMSSIHVDSTHKSHGKATDKISHLSGQSQPPSTFKTSATLSNPRSAFHNNALHQNSADPCAQSALSAETCLENMNRLSLKDPTKSSYAAQNTQLTTQVKSSKSSTGENFQPDHAAFLSILRNEGVSTTALGSATPQSKQYNCLPLRVSIMKSRSKAAATTGLEKLVQFSPDTAALQSILQNQGVNAGGLVGATPGKSVCPSGRGTSIYTAQRVPIRKNLTEATGGPVVALKETPQRKWTPQRIRDTRHQPISAMKWHLSTQQSPYTNTPGLRSCKTNLQPHQEEIVQRLFDDQEEQNTDKDPETQTEQLPVQALSTKPHCEEKGESSRTNSSEDDEEQRVAGVKLFLQAPQRESVIFFSTCKKLVRAPLFEKSSSDQDQHVPVSSEQRNVLPLHEVMSSVSEPTCQINASVQSLRRDLIAQKTHNLSPVVALLRKRLPPLEELRMDEEVATYTSVSVPAAPGFVPPRPRCRNPLASVLHFEESSRFVPIGFDLPSGSSSPHGSAQQER
nr:PREDICTED: tastin isoform X1 [Paralichthys olivaceus]